MLLINCSVMFAVNLFFFILYERLRPQPEEILPLVVICCGASLGRVIFAIVPQVQPVTALVIIMGSVYGCRRGYVTGALCALVSNLFLGQGPWTLFQMAAWGTVGLLAGVLGSATRNLSQTARTWIFAGYGFVAAFLFSIITDLLSVSYLGDALSFSSAAAIFGTGLAFGVSHAVCNFILLLSFYGILSRKLMRIKQKTRRKHD